MFPVPVSIISKKRKSLQIKVTSKQIIVFKPFYIPKYFVQQILKKNYTKIIFQLNQQYLIPEKTYTHGEKLLFLGKPIYLNLASNIFKTTLNHDELLIPQKYTNDLKLVKKQVLNWYKKKATQIIVPQVHLVAEKINTPPNKITFRNNKTRWGSCNSKKNLSFNIRIMQAPLPVINYVIVHECCHLKIMNHSMKFWNLVSSLMPKYQDHQIWLKKYGEELSL